MDNKAQTENSLVAKTILEQLGGGRLMTMTGASSFVAVDRGLMFRIPRAKNGINRVKIELTAADDYTITFHKMRANVLAVVSSFDGIYCDQLQTIFEEETGLLTNLVGQEVR